MNRVDNPQYERLAKGATVVPLQAWSIVRAAGRDRQTFLNNLCTNDLRPLAAGEGIETFFTDVKGKVLAAAYVAVADESIDLLLVPDQATGLIAHLDRYCIREDVQFADATGNERRWLALGERAGEAISTAANVSPAELPVEAWRHGRFEISGAEVTMQPCPLLYVPAWLIGAAADGAATVVHALHEAGAADGAEDFFQTVRIESGWPLFGIDFGSENLPQEVARDAQAISFRKGCYLGQETVARIDALGHVNRRLVTLRADDRSCESLAVGAELQAGEQVVGRITSVCHSPRLGGPVALAMVRRGANSAGTKLTCGAATVDIVSTPAVARRA